MGKKVNLGVLVSGSGSNLQAIIDNIEKGFLDAIIKIVISNNPDAYALQRCQRHNLKAVIIDHKAFSTREDFDKKAIEILQNEGVELVIMAGFMRLLSPLFFQAFPMKIMNIHPALLPSFPGIHVQKKAVEYGVKFSGCTVHFADEGMDTGPIIMQAVVPVYDDDTEETLTARILKEEHRIYSEAIQYYAEGRMFIKDQKVIIIDAPRAEEKPMHNPPLLHF